MKTQLPKFGKSVLVLFIMVSCFIVNAQSRIAPADGANVNFTIENLTKISDKVFEFDLYLKDLGSDKPFELSLIQMGILVNSEIINDGEVMARIVPGFSELTTAQQPGTTLFVKAKGNSVIKVAAKIGPGAGNGTIIKKVDKGTKICRIRLTNTVPFAKAKPNLTFCFSKLPYPTKIYHYVDKVSVQIKTDASNCFGDKVNHILNE